MRFKYKFLLASMTIALICFFGIDVWALPLSYTKYGIQMNELSSSQEPDAPPAGRGNLYILDPGSGTMTLIFQDDQDTTTDLITNASGGDLDDAYNNGGTITADGGAVTINNTDADNANNLTVNKSPSGSASGYAIGIVAGANCTGSAIDIANSGTGYDIDGTSSTWYVTKAGAITCASLSATLNYMTAIAAAASGNSNLTIDAAGTGTITLGGNSTGNIVHSSATKINGNCDIGDAATDTLTITSIIDGNVTLDDGTTTSPSLIFKDGTDETMTIAKVDTGFLTMTASDAGDGVQITTGNLRVGNGSNGVSLTGEGFYCEGTSEFDGASVFDGTLTANGAVSCVSTLALSENVTFTMAADEYLKLDAATTPMTQTAGALDINVINGATGVSAILMDLEAENTFAALYGLYINIDDDASGGDETIHGIYIANSEGTASTTIGMSIANTIDDGIVATVGAAGQAMVVDAATADHTETAGVFDIAFDTVTNGASAINIDMGTTTGGTDSDDYSAILIDLDDDATDATVDIIGVKVTSSDLTGATNSRVIGLYSSGLDCALQADNGYVRIGTGSTPGVTPGDDDLYVEGTAEIDGNLYPDGDVIGDGATKIYGVKSDVSACTAASNLAIADAGKIITNTGAGGTVIMTLPEGSTAIGCSFSFAVTAVQQLNVNPYDGTDQILGITNAAGDSIQSNATGDFITVTCVGNDAWVVTASNNSNGNADGWSDSN